MEKFFPKLLKKQKSSPILETSSTNIQSSENECGASGSKRVREEVNVSDDDIIGDPGLRRPIDDYPIEMRDGLRRQYLAKGPCQPINHDFPFRNFPGERRKFQVSWFQRYRWLDYSVSKDAVYCFLCYLFAEGHNHGDDKFTKIGQTNWQRGLEKFKHHEGGSTSIHSGARVRCIGYQDQRHNVDYVLAAQTDELEVAYRIRLTAVVKVVRLLLKGGLPFRGHDESEDSEYKGNFLEWINFYCEECEHVMNVMNSRAPGNNQLTSPTIQKQIISACATETRKLILNEIGDKNFALLVDESRDCSTKEQMSVVLRYVNDFGVVIERFLGLVHVSDTSAQCLKKAIDDFFAKHGLSLSKLRGQGYDGASNMRGEFNGLKALILKDNKHAHYIHCFAHQLQLVVVATAKDHDSVSDFFDIVAIIVNTVGASCKRMDALRQQQYEDCLRRIQNLELATGTGLNQEKGLARAGDTRWSSHYTTLCRLIDLWNPVKVVLHDIRREGKDQKTRGAASGLILKLKDFEFAFIAHLMKMLLGKTNILSRALQQKEQNMANALVLIRILKEDLQKWRNDGWNEFLKEVTEFCSKHDIDVPDMEDIIPTRIRRDVDNQPKTFLHHFRRELFIQVIDLIASEMDHRFAETNSELLMCISCLHPANSFANFDKNKLLRLGELYSEDFDGPDMDSLGQQLSYYNSQVILLPAFSGLNDIGDLAKMMIQTNLHELYPLVYRLIELALILPVATASVERSFSAMKYVKTDLRNKMGDEFLTDALVCYAEIGIFKKVETEAILQRFQSMASRRLQLPPLSRMPPLNKN